MSTRGAVSFLRFAPLLFGSPSPSYEDSARAALTGGTHAGCVFAVTVVVTVYLLGPNLLPASLVLAVLASLPLPKQTNQHTTTRKGA